MEFLFFQILIIENIHVTSQCLVSKKKENQAKFNIIAIAIIPPCLKEPMRILAHRITYTLNISMTILVMINVLFMHER